MTYSEILNHLLFGHFPVHWRGVEYVLSINDFGQIHITFHTGSCNTHLTEEIYNLYYSPFDFFLGER